MNDIHFLMEEIPEVSGFHQAVAASISNIDKHCRLVFLSDECSFLLSCCLPVACFWKMIPKELPPCYSLTLMLKWLYLLVLWKNQMVIVNLMTAELMSKSRIFLVLQLSTNYICRMSKKLCSVFKLKTIAGF